ncbi:uncharacterized protein LOC106469800 [Limulus polyphemus]|uniref:Uncharacterized protein LOC106469800 n=1 Tax=Limulus polyphemus TaxID=6850 RepID=A0ABM1TG69_LIMPO|nr:uncharacterized protein LOC106469800 [Limulus polyphemus]XP_022254875.1 uncharacterized protein LOC106469800 [Limulus polyphemus]XP_022254881.1 uncharacterized protein LOC106469800 [Limulus polyphemus]
MMTLVLPAFCSNYPPSLNSFVSRENTSMPCGFDSEPLDFESVLFSVEWPSSLRDVTESAQDSDLQKITPVSATGNNPGEGELTCADKRKLPQVSECELKRPKKDYENITISNGSKEVDPGCAVLVLDKKSKNNVIADHELGHEQDQEMLIDDAFLPSRRRVPQLWNPRMRWKDERRKVLKLSLNKLRRIKDPEIFLCRSVLINNTVKHLQKEIREEKNARHHAVGRTSYILGSCSSSANPDSCEPHSTSKSWSFDAEPADIIPRKSLSDSVSFSSVSSTEEGIPNYDELFNLEEVLQIDEPCRQSKSHAETASGQLTGCYSVSCTCPVSSSDNECPKHVYSSSCRGKNQDDRSSRRPASPNPCATQYRINHDSYRSDAPSQGTSVLDSVVYQSLLASLET